MLPTSWKSFHVVFSVTLRGHFDTKRLVKIKHSAVSTSGFLGRCEAKLATFVTQVHGLLIKHLSATSDNAAGDRKHFTCLLTLGYRSEAAICTGSGICQTPSNPPRNNWPMPAETRESKPSPLINRESLECLWTFPNKAQQCSKNHSDGKCY